MKLIYANASPYARKVRIVLAEKKLDYQLVLENPWVPETTIGASNPLGKVPCLVLEGGEAIFDSRVIVEYLDVQAGGGKIIPASGKDRFDALTLQALADGIMDAAILQIYEIRFREEDRREPKWVEHQMGKVERGLDALEAHLPHLSPVPTIGTIGLACTLGYLDFRFGGTWRSARPRLVAWLNDFAARYPAYAETAPH